MGRRVESETTEPTPFGEDRQRNHIYARYLKGGLSPDLALKKAKAWRSAKQRMRAIDRDVESRRGHPIDGEGG